MNHVRADRWYKLARTILYGRLEDEAPFQSVRRLVQHEDHALRLMRDAGIPTARPVGIVELTPEREYMLVTGFFDGAVELGDAEVDDVIIDEGLAIVRRMWDAGLAHRDIKPANLLVRDGHLAVIDVAFAQVRPSPWRQAVDLANMMLVLAVRTDADRVYGRALAVFTARRDRRGVRRRTRHRQPDPAADGVEGRRSRPARPLPGAGAAAPADPPAALGRAASRPGGRRRPRAARLGPRCLRDVHARRPAAERHADVWHDRRARPRRAGRADRRDRAVPRQPAGRLGGHRRAGAQRRRAHPACTPTPAASASSPSRCAARRTARRRRCGSSSRSPTAAPACTSRGGYR